MCNCRILEGLSPVCIVLYGVLRHASNNVRTVVILWMKFSWLLNLRALAYQRLCNRPSDISHLRCLIYSAWLSAEWRLRAHQLLSRKKMPRTRIWNSTASQCAQAVWLRNIPVFIRHFLPRGGKICCPRCRPSDVIFCFASTRLAYRMCWLRTIVLAVE
jgi:hypothetical protein